MSTPKIKILGTSISIEGDEKTGTRSQIRLHGRVTVFNPDRSFDTVRIRLQGAVRTNIGTQVAVQRIPSTVEIKKSLDFKPAYSPISQELEEQYLDFICPVPVVSSTNTHNGTLDGFVPSMRLSGSTFVTKVTALRDRHLVEGSCEVVYLLEAEFLHSATGRVVRKISCPVDLSSTLAPLDVQATSLDGLENIEQIAKPQTRSLNKFLNHQSRPEYLVSIPKKLGHIVADSSRLATGCRRLTVPVTVSVAVPTLRRRQTQSAFENGQLRCSVKSRWYSKRTFTTGNSAVESVVHNDRVSTQRFSVALPPLYKLGFEDSKYTTSMALDLLLPESMSTPSISTELLNVEYTLDLSMKFELVGDESSKAPYTADFSVPVTLRDAHPESILSHRSFDPFLGIVEEEALYAPPPYIC